MSSVTAPGGMLRRWRAGRGQPGSMPPPVLPSAFSNRRPVHEIGIPSQWLGLVQVLASLVLVCPSLTFFTEARGKFVRIHTDQYKLCLLFSALYGVALQL